MGIVIKPPVLKKNPDRNVTIPTSLAGKLDAVVPQQDPEAKPNTNKVRAEFRVEEFVRAIHQHGNYCTWRKALLCPCLLPDTQQADPNCSRCDGSGFFYVDPIHVRALILSVDKGMNLYEKMGTWVTGQASITVEPQFRLGYRDSIELRDALMIFDEYLVKGSRRGIRAKLPAGCDSGRYRIVNVVFLVYLDTATDTLRVLEADTHFKLRDGWLEWTAAGNAAIPAGATYSIRYEFHPTFVVESYPHVMRNDVVSKKNASANAIVALPTQAVGKLDYLLNVNGASGLPTTW